MKKEEIFGKFMKNAVKISIPSFRKTIENAGGNIIINWNPRESSLTITFYGFICSMEMDGCRMGPFKAPIHAYVCVC